MSDRTRSPSGGAVSSRPTAEPLDTQAFHAARRDIEDFIPFLGAGAGLGPNTVVDASGVNLLDNGGFENGLDKWTVVSATLSIDTTKQTEGLQSAKLTTTGSIPGLTSDPAALPDGIGAVLVTCDSQSDGASPGIPMVAGLGALFYDDSGAPVGFPSYGYDSVPVVAVGSWSSHALLVLVPPSATAVAFTISWDPAGIVGSSNTVWLDNASIQPATIFSGYFTTNPYGQRVEVYDGEVRFWRGDNAEPGDTSAPARIFGLGTKTNWSPVVGFTPPPGPGLVVTGAEISGRQTPRLIFSNGAGAGAAKLVTDSKLEVYNAIKAQSFVGNRTAGGLLNAAFTVASTGSFQSAGEALVFVPPIDGVTAVGVQVSIHLSCIALVANQGVRCKAGISYDNGGSWSDSTNACLGTCGNLAGGCVQLPMFATHGKTGIPTDNIRVRLTVQLDGGTPANFQFTNIWYSAQVQLEQ